MKLQYKARTKEGELQAGNVDAINQDAALTILKGHGLFVLSIEEVKAGSWIERTLSALQFVSTKDLMIFTRQFSALLSAGIPLADTLRTLQKQTKNIVLRDALFEVASDIDSGFSLSQAFGKHERIFSPFYVNMIRSAEVTGRMDDVVSYLADYIEKENQLTSKTMSALIYPAVMILMFIIVGVIMAIWILPDLAPVFEESGVQLPWFTRMVLHSGDFFRQWWMFILAGGIIFGSMLVDYFRSKEGRAVVDEISLRVPGVGLLLRNMYIARFSESVSVLLKGGIPAAQALEITAQTIGSVVYQDVLGQIALDVRRGELFSQAVVKQEVYFSAMVNQMIAIGESTGRLENMLKRVSDYYMREVDTLVNNLVELIQPLLLVFIGVAVGVMFMSILKPIYSLVESFGG